MPTSTSIIGTLICGSSSRGRLQVANTPSSTDPRISSGVRGESMNFAARVPAMPRWWSSGSDIGLAGVVVRGREGGEAASRRPVRNRT
jgi:hypothetical protein